MTCAASDPLAVAAQAGDRRAFEALVRREKAGLYAFVRRYVGDADDAYDVVQESFVAAWRAFGRFDPQRSFPVWLRTIALNKCRDHGRRGKVRRLFLGAFADQPTAAPADGEETADEDLARLDRAIGKLPDLYKAPLLLTTAGGLSHEDAASVLKISAKAVEMRLYRARKRLAELIDLTEGSHF
jgi:RNA polymerase sigma factor (sigma-70 family)